MRFSTITAIGSFTALNGGATDSLRLIPNRCVDSPSLRTTIENKAGTSGVNVSPPMKGPRIITLGGDIEIGSAGDEAGYFAAIDTLLGSLQAALDALEAAPDDLVHSAGTLLVWAYSPLVPSWEGVTQSVTFGLSVDF